MTLRKHSPAFALTLLFAVNFLNFFDRNLYGALVEPIRHEWSLSDAQVGWLGTAFTLLYAVVGVPFGRLADRWRRTWILSLGLAAWSLLTAASGLAWNFFSFFVTRLSVGIGEASCAPAANSLLADYFPARRRGLAVSIFMLGLPLGLFTGTFFSGHIAASYGWRAPFFIACVPGLLLAGFVLLLAEPRRGSAESAPSPVVAPAPAAISGSPYLRVLRIPAMRWIVLSGALLNFNSYALATFLPAFLMRYHGLPIARAAAITAVVLGLTGLPGLLLGGWISDVAHRWRTSGRLLLAAAALLLCAPLIYLSLLSPAGSVTLFAVLMAAGFLLSYIYYSGVYTAIQDIVPADLRGTAVALYFFGMYLLGGSFGPVVTGRLSDFFAHRAMNAAGASAMTDSFRTAGLHSALFVIPLSALALAAVLLAAARSLPSDKPI
ncbi:MAG: MFS transporter [Acidobacteriia bacterium]|nr:MFS transporter [Terriglobia bacterium]